MTFDTILPFMEIIALLTGCNPVFYVEDMFVQHGVAGESIYEAQTWFDTGTNEMYDEVEGIYYAPLTQFDDVQVTGIDVLTALKTYRDSNYAVVICNRSSGNPYTSTPKDSVNLFGQNYCAKLEIPPTDLDTAELYDTGVYWSELATRFCCEGLNIDEPESNTYFAPTCDESNEVTYVSQDSMWHANRIYSDRNGEVCGILFQEIVTD